MIAERLKSEVPKEKVLDQIRENAKELTSPLSLINLKDINYIKRDFGFFEGRQDPNDFISVQKLIKHLQQQDDKVIRFYRAPVTQEEAEFRETSFMLIFATDFQLSMLKKCGDRATVCLDSTIDTT